MYLQYILKPHFLKETFTIQRPVGSVEESDSFVKHAMNNQGKGKTYSSFKLLDMSKRNIVKLYRKMGNHQSQNIVNDLNRKMGRGR
jgi:hypothetical protein